MKHTSIGAELLGRALAVKRKSARGDEKAILRYKRAALELLGGVAWTYDDATDVLLMGSTTTAGVTYRVTFLECTCKAGTSGLICVHSAAFDLLQSALWTEPAHTKQVQRYDDARYAEALAAADEMF